METIRSRRERIQLITTINSIVERYQGRVLSSGDFDMLWELDQDQLINVYNSMRDQVDTMKQFSNE